MGHTHYLYRPYRLPKAPFVSWVKDCRKILDNLPESVPWWEGGQAPLMICGGLTWNGDDKPLDQQITVEPPTLTDQLISFTGYGGTVHFLNQSDGSVFLHSDMGCEHLYVPRTYQKLHRGQKKGDDGLWFTFCKTRELPYDLAVVACLIRLAYHFPETVKISSDGDSVDWEPGRQLVQQLFGVAILPPEITRREEVVG